MNIVLMGYMGCGKSSIGRGLAEKLELEYVDLDAYIEKQEKKSIKQIFETKGEIYFRKIETQYLQQLLETAQQTILSLGGGTPCFSGNIERIKAAPVHSIYLKTSIEELVKRLYVEKEQRPLIAHIASEELLADFVRKHLFERSFYYSQAAHTVTTDQKTIATIVDEIQERLF